MADCWIYEWSDKDQEWKQLHYIPNGTNIDTLPLWKKVRSKRPIKGPSDKQVDAAIKSILKAGES